MDRAIALIRNADWFGGGRANAYARVLLLGAAISFALFYAFFISNGVRVDFASYWTAARMGDAYDLQAQAVEQCSAGSCLPFFYPPPFLTLVMPLGLLSYKAAYLVWTAGTYAVYLFTAWRLFPKFFWLIAAFPAALLNAMIGQNGAIMAALLCGAALQFPKRPFVAGMLLGGFILKPHLALLFPVAMIAGRHWKVIAGASVSSACLLATSLLIVGSEAWASFLSNTGFTRSVLENWTVLWPKMISVFAAVKYGGGPTGLAYAAQTTVIVALAVIVWRAWTCDADGKFAILAVAAVAATPYGYGHDLMLLIIPICWLAGSNFVPWSKFILAAAYLLPITMFGTQFKLGPTLPLIVLALVMVLARSKAVPGPLPAPASDAVARPAN